MVLTRDAMSSLLAFLSMVKAGESPSCAQGGWRGKQQGYIYFRGRSFRQNFQSLRNRDVLKKLIFEN